MDAQLRDAALDYASRGWPVFPVSRAKRPMITDWPNQATTDPFKVWAWWRRWPNANIGTPTGIHFDVLDVDTVEALAALEQVVANTGTPFVGPITLTGRGWQLFYAPTGLRNRKPALDGVDFRGQGGFVILPPSVHANGNVYTWLRDPWPDDHGSPFAAFGPFPDMRPNLITALWPKRPHRKVGSATPEPVDDPSRLRTWADAALRGIRDELASVPSGQGLRNDALNRLGFRAFQLAHVLGEATVEAAILDAAEANGDVADHGPERVQRTIRSARAGIAHPRFPELRT